MAGPLSGVLVGVVGERGSCEALVRAFGRLGAHPQWLAPEQVEAGHVSPGYYDAVVWPRVDEAASVCVESFRRSVLDAGGVVAMRSAGTSRRGAAEELDAERLRGAEHCVVAGSDVTDAAFVEAVAAAVVRRISDRVDEASRESFPASDAAGGTLVVSSEHSGEARCVDPAGRRAAIGVECHLRELMVP
jgi:hypothetical protein